MKEEKETSCIAILPRSSHDIDVVMLDEKVSNSILQQNWIVRSWIILHKEYTSMCKKTLRCPYTPRGPRIRRFKMTNSIDHTVKIEFGWGHILCHQNQ